MTKQTDPKYKNDGFDTRSKITTGMANHPRGNEFKAISYSGKTQKAR